MELENYQTNHKKGLYSYTVYLRYLTCIHGYIQFPSQEILTFDGRRPSAFSGVLKSAKDA
jgi:hypothetical protein